MVICNKRDECGWEKRKNQWKCYHAEPHEKDKFCCFGGENHNLKGFSQNGEICAYTECIDEFIFIVKDIVKGE